MKSADLGKSSKNIHASQEYLYVGYSILVISVVARYDFDYDLVWSPKIDPDSDSKRRAHNLNRMNLYRPVRCSVAFTFTKSVNPTLPRVWVQMPPLHYLVLIVIIVWHVICKSRLPPPPLPHNQQSRGSPLLCSWGARIFLGSTSQQTQRPILTWLYYRSSCCWDRKTQTSATFVGEDVQSKIIITCWYVMMMASSAVAAGGGIKYVSLSCSHSISIYECDVMNKSAMWTHAAHFHSRKSLQRNSPFMNFVHKWRNKFTTELNGKESPLEDHDHRSK